MQSADDLPHEASPGDICWVHDSQVLVIYAGDNWMPYNDYVAWERQFSKAE